MPELVERFTNEPVEALLGYFEIQQRKSSLRVLTRLRTITRRLCLLKNRKQAKNGHYLIKTYNKLVSPTYTKKWIEDDIRRKSSKRQRWSGDRVFRMYDKKAQYEDKNLIPPGRVSRALAMIRNCVHEETRAKISWQASNKGRRGKKHFQEIAQTSSWTASAFQKLELNKSQLKAGISRSSSKSTRTTIFQLRSVIWQLLNAWMVAVSTFSQR